MYCTFNLLWKIVWKWNNVFNSDILFLLNSEYVGAPSLKSFCSYFQNSFSTSFNQCKAFLIKSIRSWSTNVPLNAITDKAKVCISIAVASTTLMLIWKGRRTLWRRDGIHSLLMRWKSRKRRGECSNPDRFVPSVCFHFKWDIRGYT